MLTPEQILEKTCDDVVSAYTTSTGSVTITPSYEKAINVHKLASYLASIQQKEEIYQDLVSKAIAASGKTFTLDPKEEEKVEDLVKDLVENYSKGKFDIQHKIIACGAEEMARFIRRYMKRK